MIVANKTLACRDCRGKHREDSPVVRPIWEVGEREPVGYIRQGPCPECGGRGPIDQMLQLRVRR